MQTFFRDEMIVTSSDLTIPAHQKALRLISALRQHGHTDFVDDFPSLSWHQWTGIHDADYVRLIAAADAVTFDAASIPASIAMVTSIEYSAGSMIAASSAAINTGCTFSPTAGFHHAHWSRPGSFCLLNALPLAAVHALNHSRVNNVLILDCDFHRGDGTDDILARLNDSRISHQSLGFRFSHRSQSADYLLEVDRICRTIGNGMFDFVVYQAGMDVLVGDPAGGGILTLAETRERDSRVFAACSRTSTPVVWNLAGGYRLPANGYDLVVQGHLNTFDCAVQAFP